MLILSFVYYEYNVTKMILSIQKTEKTDYFNVDLYFICNCYEYFYKKRYYKINMLMYITICI